MFYQCFSGDSTISPNKPAWITSVLRVLPFFPFPTFSLLFVLLPCGYEAQADLELIKSLCLLMVELPWHPAPTLFLINVTRSWSRGEQTQLSISSWEAGATVEIEKLLFSESAKIGISCQGVLGNHFQEPKACSLSVLRDTRKTNN